MLRALAAAAAVLALAGCGGEDDAGGGGDPAPGVELAITVTADGTTREATLECEPEGGTHPEPKDACRALAANAGHLEPIPQDVACTQEYGGPERARIRGRIRDREIDTRLSRANGCEISRWDHLEVVLALD